MTVTDYLDALTWDGTPRLKLFSAACQLTHTGTPKA